MYQTLKKAIILGLLFFVLSLPVSFQTTTTWLKPLRICTTFLDRQGLPTMTGSLIHTAVFTLLALILLSYKAEQPSTLPKKIEKPETIKL